LLVALDLAGIPDELRVLPSLWPQGKRDAVRGLTGTFDVAVEHPIEADLIAVNSEHLVVRVDATPNDFHFR